MQAFKFVYLYFLCFQRMRIQAVKCGYLYLLLAKEDNANLKFWLFIFIVVGRR